jgi:hypothetical protein
MGQAIGVAGDIAATGGALAGLILVYLGSITASFATFQPAERRTVLASHQRRVWFAFVGFVLFLIAVALALFGKWLAIPCMVVSALMVLSIGMIGLIVAAVLTVMEIK